MTPQPRTDYSDIAAIIQTALGPLMGEMQSLKGKVDGLSIDRVTRTDLEKLRSEIVGSYVPRDSYEARHAALIDRNAQLEAMIRDLRKDTEQDIQKIHDRLESGKQQIEERIKANQEKPWTRLSQVAGYAGLAAAALDWLFQHIKF